MSDHPKDKISLASAKAILLHWLDETTRLVELLHVLWRSVSYNNLKDSRPCKGDDRLIRHIEDSLDKLYMEIEDMKERLDD